LKAFFWGVLIKIFEIYILNAYVPLLAYQSLLLYLNNIISFYSVSFIPGTCFKKNSLNSWTVKFAIIFTSSYQKKVSQLIPPFEFSREILTEIKIKTKLHQLSIPKVLFKIIIIIWIKLLRLPFWCILVILTIYFNLNHLNWITVF
jgi:hypothetical protein